MDVQARTPDHDVPTWRALFPLALVVFAVLVHASAVGPLAAEMARNLGVSVPLIGQVSTLGLAAMAVAGLLAGPLADHFGYRRALLLALVTLAASAALMGLAPSYPALLAGGLVAGIGATVLGVVFACAAARYRGDARRVALARIQSVQTSGSILGAPLLTAIAAAFVWRGAYGVVLVCYLVAIALVARTLPRDPHPAGRFTARTVLAAYHPLPGDGDMLALYGASALRALGWMGSFLYVGAFFAGRGLALRQIGLAYMIASGGMFAGNLAVGRLPAGVDLRRAFATATALLGLAWTAVYTLPLSTPLTVAAVTVAAGASGFGWTALTTLLAAETPAAPGITMALNGSAFALGSALGSAVGGLLVGLGGFALLGAVLPAAALAAALLAWRPRLALLRARAWLVRRAASD
jgi:MFS transporter, DHA1 family, inner membrane transport protein